MTCGGLTNANKKGYEARSFEEGVLLDLIYMLEACSRTLEPVLRFGVWKPSHSPTTDYNYFNVIYALNSHDVLF